MESCWKFVPVKVNFSSWLVTALLLPSTLSLIQTVTNSSSQLKVAAVIAANFIASSYNPEDCTVQLIHNNDGHSEEWTSYLAQSLEGLKTNHKAIFVFTVDTNLTYTARQLERFLRWEKRCVVTVLFLTSGSRDNATVDFAMKVAARHRDSLIFLIYPGDADSRKLWKGRFRNFKSACALALTQRNVVCFEDELDEDLAERQTYQQKYRGTRQRTLSGKKLRAFAFRSLPIAEWRYSRADGIITGDGVDYRMLETLSKFYNFTFTLEDPPNGIWGTLSKDEKSYEGMVGEVLNAAGDVAIGDIFNIWQRAIGGSFALYDHGCTKFVVPAATRVENWVSVASVFDSPTWGLYLGSGFLLVVAWIVTRYVEAKYEYNKDRKVRSSERLVWPDVIAQGLATIMRHKGEFRDEPLVFRILINAWILVSFAFAGIFFKTVLTQKLTALEFEPPVETVEELVRRRIPLQNGELYVFLDELYPQYALSSIVDKSITYDYKECMTLIASRKKKVAMLSAERLSSYLQRTEYWDTANGKPLFHITSRCYMPANVGWMLQKHAFFEKTFNDAMMRFNEAGLIREWDKELVQKKRAELESSGLANSALAGDEQRVLGMDHLDWVFWLGLYGIVASMVVFLLELAHHKLRHG